MATIMDFQSEDFSHFLSISHSDTSYQVSSQLGLGFKRRSEKKMATMATILDFLISRILAIFDLQDTLIVPTKFGVIWPLVQEMK